MAIPTLYASQPIAISATYDKLWVEEIVISAPEVGGDATARVRLRHFRTTDNGVECSPDTGVLLRVENLLASSTQDPDLAAAVQALMAYVAKIGQENGVVA